jgi:hypothetical protein
VVQHPADGGVALVGGVVGVGEVGGVGTEQVVEGVAAGYVFGEQGGAGQLGQQRPCLSRREPRQAGRRGG